jgi:hypothetical protein
VKTLYYDKLEGFQGIKTGDVQRKRGAGQGKGFLPRGGRRELEKATQLPIEICARWKIFSRKSRKIIVEIFLCSFWLSRLIFFAFFVA